MNVLVTNQIMPKHSLETLATMSNFKYFGHKYTAQVYEKFLILKLTGDNGE